MIADPMFRTMTMHAGDGDPSADPGGIARAREAAGWTHEQLADVVGALPVEVAAWESGAVALSAYQQAHVLWQVQSREYERALAERSGCDWLRQHRPRLDELSSRGSRGAGWAARRIATHRAECEHCRAAIRDLGPAPVEPAATARERWAARLPPPLRLLASAAVTGLTWGATSWLAGLSGWWGGDAPFPPGTPLRVALFSAWWVITHRLLRPLGDRDPYLAGQILAALLVLPAVVALGSTQEPGLQSAWLWTLAVLGSGLIGLLLGARYDPESQTVL